MAAITNSRQAAITNTSPRLTTSTGYSSVTAILATPISPVAASTIGEVTTLPTGNNIKLYIGSTQQTSGVTYGVTTSTYNGLTCSVDGNGNITLSQTTWAAASDQETFEITATYNTLIYKCLYTVFKNKQGTAGSGGNAFSAILTNESASVPADSTGAPTSYAGVSTTMNVYEGGAAASGYTFSVSKSTGVQCTESTTSPTQTVTQVTTDISTIDITATKSGSPTLVKRFIITKVRSGSVGTSPTAYWVVVSAAAISKATNNTFIPSSITYSAMSVTGATSPSAYSGRFKVYENNALVFTSSAAQASYTRAPGSAGVTETKVELYLASDSAYSGPILDTQTIPTVFDGVNGVSQGTYVATVYKQATSVTTPTGGTFSFPLSTLTPPSTWLITQPSATLVPVWACDYLFSSTDLTATITAGTWGTPYVVSVKGDAGANAIIADLASESDVVATLADGTGYTLPTGNSLKLYIGGTLVTSGVTYSAPAAQNGLTLSITNAGVIGLSGTSWTTDQESFTVTATYNSTPYSAIYTIAKSKAGVAGANAVIVDLVSESDVVATLADGTSYTLPTGNSLKLYSGGTLVTSGVTYGGSTVQGGLTLNISNTGVISLAGAAWTTNQENFVVTALYNSVTYSAIYSIAKSKAGVAGANAIIVDLASENDVVAALADGTGYTLPSTNSLRLYSGGTLLTSGVTYSGNAVQNGLTLNITTAGVITLAGAAWTSNQESFTVTATYNSVTYSAIYTIAKSKAGATGANAVIVDLVSESDVVATLADGTGYTLPTGNSLKLYSGGTLLTSGVTYSVAVSTQNGLTLTIGPTSGVITLSGASWTSNQENFTVTALYNSVNYSAIYSIAKSKAGSSGTSAITAILATPSAPAASSSTGIVTTLPTGNNIKLYIGNTQQTSGVTYGVTTGTYNGLTCSVDGSGNIALSQTTWAAASNQETFEITATYNSITYRCAFTVFKNKQGTDGSGSNAFSAILTNESANVPALTDGTPTSYAGVSTTMNIYDGGAPASGYTFSVSKSAGVQCAESITSPTQTVTQVTTDISTIDFTATKNNSPTLVKRFIITKVKAGNAGSSPTAYWVVVSAAAISKSIAGVFTPSSITYSAMSVTGSTSPVAYSGRFKVYENGSPTPVYTSSAAEASYTRAPTNSSVTQTKIELYLASDSSYSGPILDTQTIPTVADGATGGTGNTGQSNHRVYIAAAIASPPSTPASTTSGATPAGWSATPVSLATGQAQYQSDGVTPAGVTTTTWSTPYQSYLKVDTLEAIAASTGNLTIGTNGSIKSGAITYGGDGFFLGYDATAPAGYKFSVGSGTSKMSFNGTTLSVPAGVLSGQVVSGQIANNAITASKILVTGQGAALNDDPNCIDQAAWAGWSVQPPGTVTAITDGKSGNSVLRSSSNTRSINAKLIPADPGKKYRLSVWVRQQGNGVFYLRTIDYEPNENIALGTERFWDVEAVSPPLGVWTKYTREVSVAAGKAAFVPQILLAWGGSTGYMEAQGIRIEEKSDSDLIVNGAITTNKLLVTGRGASLNDDPAMTDLSAWILDSAGSVSFFNGTSAANAVGNTYVGVTNSTFQDVRISSRRIPINPNKVYRATANFYVGAGNNRNMYLFIRMFRSDGSELTGADTGWGGTLAGYVYGGQPTPSVFTRVGGLFGRGQGSATIPASVVEVAIGVWFQYSAGSSSVLHAAQDVSLEEAVDADLIVDGAITASKVQTGLLSADNVLTKGLTVRDLAGNIILSAGIPLAAKNSAAVGNENLITSPHNFTTWTYYNGSLTTSATEDRFGGLNGVRLTLSSTNADVYRSVNNLKVNGTYRVNIWYKRETAGNFVITLNNGALWNTGESSVNIATGWALATAKITTSTGNINMHIGAHGNSGTQQLPGTVLVSYIELFETTPYENTNISMSPTGTLNGAGGGSLETIRVLDRDRGIDRPPNYYPVGTTREFKDASALGLNAADGYYVTLETIKQYADGGGGYPGYQYAYQNAKTWRRRATNDQGTGWTAWVQDLDRAAYTGDLDATLGARAGTNLLDSAGVLLNNTDIRNNQITVDSYGNIVNIGTPNIQVNNAVLPLGSNILYNADFSNGTDGWTLVNAGTTIGSSGVNYTTDWRLAPPGSTGSDVLYAQQSNRTANTSTYFEWQSSPVPVVAQKRYVVSAYTGAHDADVSVFAYIYDANNTYLNYTTNNTNNTNNAEKQGGKALTDYKRIWSYEDMPVGAAYIIFVIRKVDTNSPATNSWLFAARCQVEEVAANVTTPGQWSSPGYTDRTSVRALNPITESNASLYIANAAIDIAKIKVASIGTLEALSTSTGSLVVSTNGFVRSGQTAYSTGIGFYLGNDGGTPKFSIGNSAGAYMRWTGSALEIVNPTLTLPSFSASASGASPVNVGNGVITSAFSSTVTVSGGSGGNTYAWSLEADYPYNSGSVTIESGANSSTVELRSTGTDIYINAFLTCTVIDSNGRSIIAIKDVIINHGTPGNSP